MVSYTGHGSSNNGTNWVYLSKGLNKGFEDYPLEANIRNISIKYPENSFVIGVFDACQSVTGLKPGDQGHLLNFAKANEYEEGSSNLLLIKSCPPTLTTLVADRFTHALIEQLNKKALANPNGDLVLPIALKGFNHKNKVEKIDNCAQSIKI